ncbi:hypothetical protein RRG08_005902 [Elysia crispata]|uniref:Uncharacterized protein n=1 Tax=Elysia crispata TaxID=231223 RepID=A0AAE0Y4L7_9GAST|nr:hypothetical protein RRG08_005902 [Elysia crispata]
MVRCGAVWCGARWPLSIVVDLESAVHRWASLHTQQTLFTADDRRRIRQTTGEEYGRRQKKNTADDRRRIRQTTEEEYGRRQKKNTADDRRRIRQTTEEEYGRRQEKNTADDR